MSFTSDKVPKYLTRKWTESPIPIINNNVGIIYVIILKSIFNITIKPIVQITTIIIIDIGTSNASQERNTTVNRIIIIIATGIKNRMVSVTIS